MEDDVSYYIGDRRVDQREWDDHWLNWHIKSMLLKTDFNYKDVTEKLLEIDSEEFSEVADDVRKILKTYGVEFPKSDRGDLYIITNYVIDLR